MAKKIFVVVIDQEENSKNEITAGNILKAILPEVDRNDSCRGIKVKEFKEI